MSLSALVVALAALAALSLFHPSASRIHTWPLALVAVAWWLTPMAALGLAFQRCSAWRIPSAPLLAGSLLLVAGAVISAALSPFASVSLPRVWPTLGGVALYLWLHHAWSADDSTRAAWLDRVGRGLAWAGVLFAAVSFVEWSQGTWPLPWGSRNDRPFGHSTYTAGAAVLVLPWVVLQAWRAGGPGRLGWLLGGGGVLAVLVSTSSRGGVLAIAGLGFVAVVAASVQARWSRRSKVLFAALLLAVGATVILTNPRLRELVMQRQWSELSRESNLQRQAMFEAGLRLGTARPVLGWGPGTVPLAYPRVRAQLDGGIENVLQLHNTPVQVWATTGGIGVVAMLLLVAGTLTAIVRSARTPCSLAAAASLLGYGLVALTDHQLDLPFFAGLVAISLALLTTSARVDGRPISLSSLIRHSAGLLLLAVTILAGVATIRDLQARRHYDDALTALGTGRSTDYLKALDRATESSPGDPFFQHQAAAYLLDLRASVPGAAEQAALTRDAALRLQRSLVAGSHEEFAHFNLGWLDLELDRPRDAAPHFTAAARLVPDKGGVYFGLGLAHLAAGNREAALRAFALEAINDPRSLTSPAWELPRLAALQADVRNEVRRLFADLRPSHPAAATVAAWTRWWTGEAVSVEEMRPGFNAASAQFLAALPAMNAGQAVPDLEAPWHHAYRAWRSCREPGAAATPEIFLRTAAGDRTFAAALARRAQRHRDDFRAFLTEPTGDEPALLRTLRHRRQGYGMLALHPEGPPLHDAYVVQENRAVAELAAGLFPAKGWLPGRFLLALLPESPR